MAGTVKTYAKILAGLAPEQLDGFVGLLREDGVLLQAEQIMAAAESIINREALARTVTVTSAKEIDKDAMIALKKKIAELVSDPIVKWETDESLLAGTKVELPGLVVDGSLSGRLKSLNAALKS